MPCASDSGYEWPRPLPFAKPRMLASSNVTVQNKAPRSNLLLPSLCYIPALQPSVHA